LAGLPGGVGAASFCLDCRALSCSARPASSLRNRAISSSVSAGTWAAASGLSCGKGIAAGWGVAVGASVDIGPGRGRAETFEGASGPTVVGGLAAGGTKVWAFASEIGPCASAGLGLPKLDICPAARGRSAALLRVGETGLGVVAWLGVATGCKAVESSGLRLGRPGWPGNGPSAWPANAMDSVLA